MLEILVFEGGFIWQGKDAAPEQIMGGPRKVEVALAEGQTMANAAKQIGVAEQAH